MDQATVDNMDAFLAWLKYWLVQIVDMIHQIVDWLNNEDIFPTITTESEISSS